ncbi:MAG TPA: isoprenylcysteine carboxylmethyltransferase family protein [Candidatus Angelobacter sp.]|nr:isoprenylcysteine carboxylmethyltransferase family protein [Candidatus Angelobacter sp.]
MLNVLLSMSPMRICDALWVGFYVLWLLWAIRIKKAERRESSLSYLLHRVLVGAGFLLIFFDLPWKWLHRRMLPSSEWLPLLGITVALAGFGLAIWARMHIGRNWSSAVVAKSEHELICSGPYRWVRHPIYSGLMLALLGTALVQDQVRGLIALLLVYAGWKIKSRLEERMMVSTFGDQYTAYANSTGALFPRLR